MPKVKIIIVHNFDCDDDHSIEVAKEGVTDWEEISQKDYIHLFYNLHRIIKPMRDSRPILICQDETPIIHRIEQLKELIEKDRKREEKEKQAAKDRKAKKALLTQDKKKKLFEELKSEFEGRK